jgi:hypothetical protein
VIISVEVGSNLGFTIIVAIVATAVVLSRWIDRRR